MTTKKANKAEIKLNFPTIISVDDYHEFDNIIDYIERFTSKQIKFYELNNYEERYDMPSYSAIFYVGKRPIKKEIELLLEKKFEKIK